ncbi:cyclic 3',5'-adenosine monophosphate phosphodiesterase [Candidatus Methylomirabilis lanthanidiphila]|uniref:Cyclic 3',5'-adenosine monophosphate phosphodiesterase n=1 Tax=Candidatus Methylomirabilis lanthanidiphila TaxID=2211376 RepID=A0A564ZKY0_9BACT|nr:cyclic 3',5'-adenosine monophosphate phosphodiesterase [Candidatus Methylomirabilis lanthanidiphila]
MVYQQSQQGNEIFRIAHLSDLHFTSLGNIKIRDLLNKRALGYLSWRFRRRHEHVLEILSALLRDLSGLALDHIVITGDLTHIGLPGEFQQARQWLETLGSPTDVTVVPGNHDTYVNTPWQDSLALWTPYMASDPGLNIGEQRASGRSFFPSVRMRGPAVLIGATSARPSAPFFATGSLGAAQMDRLGDILDLTRRQGRFRILLIHHPPVTATVGWRKRLTDGAVLRALLTRYGVEMVLHGHAHRSSVAYLPNGSDAIPLIGVPSASSRRVKAKRRAGYYVYEVRPSSAGWEIGVSMHCYSPDDRCFVAGKQRVIWVPGAATGSLDAAVHPHGQPAEDGQRA